MKYFVFYLSLILCVGGCVPAKKFEDMRVRAEAAEKERQSLLEKLKNFEISKTECEDKLKGMNTEIASLKRDTMITGKSLRKMTSQYDKINNLNDELIKKIRQLENSNKSESVKLVSELESTRSELQKREDQLRDMERRIKGEEDKLGALSSKLKSREQRVQELENMIAEQKAAADALKQKISNALLGFRDRGLSVEQRDGKIYVSMDAKLLFASGSTTVNTDGETAINDLANVLKDQKDITIMVEGHTDTDQMRGGSIKDNWDLSVLRATSVVRILTSQGVDQTQVIPAGRGEFIPVDIGKSSEAKAKNRRIEVIITPDLDSVFELLD